MQIVKNLSDFFFLNRTFGQKRKYSARNFKTAVLIPTFTPSEETYELIISIFRWNPTSLIVVVDDHTPLSLMNLLMINRLKNLAVKNKRIVYLRTPLNALKAGALNYGIRYLRDNHPDTKIVFTLDDDIRIDKDTIPLLKDSLYTRSRIGAASSTVRVINKDKNLLTRLQALEYHGFNLTKIADNTIFKGPLVMQGMMTAFRMSSIKEVGGFREKHLIEDYDITARIKEKDWNVMTEPLAIAWTSVPESLGTLWKQRVRWTFGGLGVVRKYWKNVPLVFQDLVGHSLFLILLFFIFFSLFFHGSGGLNNSYAFLLALLALVQLIISMSYNIILLSTYEDADIWDWILKLSIIPEFVYSNILSVVLIGSYLFFIYQNLIGKIAKHYKTLSQLYDSGLYIFQKLGYSSSWGTKILEKKGGNNI